MELGTVLKELHTVWRTIYVDVKDYSPVNVVSKVFFNIGDGNSFFWVFTVLLIVKITWNTKGFVKK